MLAKLKPKSIKMNQWTIESISTYRRKINQKNRFEHEVCEINNDINLNRKKIDYQEHESV